MAAHKKRSRSRENRSSRPKNKPTPAPQLVPSGIGFGRVLCFIVFLVLAFFSFVALITYTSGQDVFFRELLEGIIRDSDIKTDACCGKLGSTFAAIAFYFFGVGAYLLPLFFALLSFYVLRPNAGFSLYWKCTQMFFLLASGSLLLSLFFGGSTQIDVMIAGPGGELGKFLHADVCEPVLGVVGSAILGILLYLFCLLALFVAPPHRIFIWCWEKYRAYAQEQKRQRAAELEKRRRLEEARRRNAWEIAGQMRETGGVMALSAGTRGASLADNTGGFDDVPVHGNAVPDYFEAEPLETLEDAPDKEETPVAPEAAPEELEAPPEFTGTLTPFTDEAPEPVPESVPVPEEKSPVKPASVQEILGEMPPVPAEVKPEPAKLRIIEQETVERADDFDFFDARGEYAFPPLDLLKAPSEQKISEASYEEFQERGEQIISALSKFKISSELTTVQVGPTITRYEITPQDDVRVEKILGLQNNIAMKLKVQSARLALVPENGTVGIEVPNQKPKPVFIREILESKAWHDNQMEIPIVLGKDVTGKPVLMDLAKMPHGLIAGSTGSGKSVCINGIVTSILYSASPEDVRLVMVDPKVVELQVYNKVPHMLIPVISDAKKVPGALKWLINEMERRYELLRVAGVRNIVGFNAKLIKDRKEAAAARERAAALEKELSAEERAAINEEPTRELSVPRDDGVLDELAAKKKMPYIVCIVDEFADLMQVAAAEIESGIARLAAKARAAGIHLILATQRPDAKTVTGLIKANLPTRIAFKVTSAVNSKIIMDETGAETLIGKGDMLFIPPGTSVLRRAQGSFVSEEEIEAIVDFLHENNGDPQYAQEVQDEIDRAAEEAEMEKNGGKNSGADELDLNDDEALMMKAWEVIRTTQRASTSSLQIKLRIGYGRATRIMDMLEERGYIGPPQSGSKTRDILRND